MWLLEIAAYNVKLAQENLIGGLRGDCVFDFTHESILGATHRARRDERNIHGSMQWTRERLGWLGQLPLLVLTLK